MKILLLIAPLALFKIVAFPNKSLLLWMGVAIAIDFITGVIKACFKGEARTSSGYRKTIIKFLQYGGTLAVGAILNNIAGQNNMPGAAAVLNAFTDGLVVFIIYIEVTSIMENIYECDKESMLCKYFIKHALNILTFQIKNNPITKIKTTDENFSDTIK